MGDGVHKVIELLRTSGDPREKAAANAVERSHGLTVCMAWDGTIHTETQRNLQR
jgi:flavin-binding protein dodecin